MNRTTNYKIQNTKYILITIFRNFDINNNIITCLHKVLLLIFNKCTNE